MNRCKYAMNLGNSWLFDFSKLPCVRQFLFLLKYVSQKVYFLMSLPKENSPFRA